MVNVIVGSQEWIPGNPWKFTKSKQNPVWANIWTIWLVADADVHLHRGLPSGLLERIPRGLRQLHEDLTWLARWSGHFADYHDRWQVSPTLALRSQDLLCSFTLFICCQSSSTIISDSFEHCRGLDHFTRSSRESSRLSIAITCINPLVPFQNCWKWIR